MAKVEFDPNDAALTFAASLGVPVMYWDDDIRYRNQPSGFLRWNPGWDTSPFWGKDDRDICDWQPADAYVRNELQVWMFHSSIPGTRRNYSEVLSAVKRVVRFGFDDGRGHFACELPTPNKFGEWLKQNGVLRPKADG